MPLSPSPKEVNKVGSGAAGLYTLISQDFHHTGHLSQT